MGPSLDVSTEDETTTAWLNEALLPDSKHIGQHDALHEPHSVCLRMQSDQGILLKVADDGLAMNVWGKVTEILLYAAAEAKSPSLPTPPGSSSPAPPGKPVESPHIAPRTIKVHALLLSSTIIDRAVKFANAITPPPEDPTNPIQACFLPNQWNPSPAEERPHQKRQSLSSLFDDATQKRRKLKSRGGESVAQAMADIDRPPSQSGLPIETNSESQEQSDKPYFAARARKGISGAQSMISAAGSDYTRPTSRSGPLGSGKRSSLHRVASAISPGDSPTFSELDDSYSEQNKAALTKIVMAGMRLYGLQQRKKKSGPTQIVEATSNALHEQEAEDEYKLVYHQTYKAASFAFRKHFPAQLIPQETMREVVDRLLDLFCTDPMASAACEDGNMSGFGTQGSDGLGAFDLPSTKNPSPAAG